MKLHYWLIVVSVAIPSIATANLLQNGSFEDEGERSDAARHWRLDDPDDHGDAWGNAIRADWRAHEGQFCGAIRGAWSAMGEYGGFWQEAAIEPGKTYRASAWFWADTAWMAGVQEMKIEFWDQDRMNLLGSESIALGEIGENWTQREITGTAPEGAAWGRVVISVDQAGEAGSLQVDSVAIEAVD